MTPAQTIHDAILASPPADAADIASASREGWVTIPARPTEKMIDDGAQRLASFGEESVWPDSWEPLDVLQMRIQAERVILSALAAAPPAPVLASSWQPIESAPRDGTRVLLWAPRWSTSRTGWTFDNDPWHDCPKQPPTHWQPLPPPPHPGEAS